MGGQLARLYLRGNLMHITAKGLSKKSLDQVQRLIVQASKCPLLHNPLSEFCMALARTIGNEYRNYEYGLQDAQVTFWRAGVQILHHESRRCERCAMSFTTTYDNPQKCARTLSYWCDELDTEEKKHGSRGTTVINKEWLKANNTKKKGVHLYKLQDQNKDKKIIDQIESETLFKARACSKCLEEKKIHFLTPEQNCEGDLHISWSPKPEIATEARFYCKCGGPRPPACFKDGKQNPGWKEHHDGDPVTSRCPAPLKNGQGPCGQEVQGEYIKRKKFLQTFLFNYLKQILRENKPPSITEVQELVSPADDVLKHMVCNLMDNAKGIKLRYDTAQNEMTHIIYTELGLLPQKIILQIADLRDEFESLGVDIKLENNQIRITPIFDLKDQFYVKMISRSVVRKTFVKFVSFDGPDDETNNNFRDFCEYKSQPEIEAYNITLVDELDRINVIRKRLPNNVQEVLDLIVRTPDAYYKAFKTERIHKNHVAQFLNRSQNDIDQAFMAIKCHLLAEGVKPD